MPNFPLDFAQRAGRRRHGSVSEFQQHDLQRDLLDAPEHRRTTYSGGGGVSQEFPGRVVPDVSYDAGVGYDVYDSFDGGGGWIDVGGTSAGAPQWAALVAIADQGRRAGLGTLGTTNNASQTLGRLSMPLRRPISTTSPSAARNSNRPAQATIWRPAWARPSRIC